MYVSSVYAMSWCGSVMVHLYVDVYDVYVWMLSSVAIMMWKCNEHICMLYMMTCICIYIYVLAIGSGYHQYDIMWRLVCMPCGVL